MLVIPQASYEALYLVSQCNFICVLSRGLIHGDSSNPVSNHTLISSTLFSRFVAFTGFWNCRTLLRMLPYLSSNDLTTCVRGTSCTVDLDGCLGQAAGEASHAG